MMKQQALRNMECSNCKKTRRKEVLEIIDYTRCKIEHPYQLIKNKFGYRNAVYCGLAKNHNRLYMLFATAR